MKRINMVVALSMLFSLSSCDDFLDKEPNKSTSIPPKTVEQLEFILNKYDEFYNERSITLSLSSDDYEVIPEMIDKNPSVLSVTGVRFATWDIDGVIKEPYDDCWAYEYQKISRANMILEYLPKVSGSSEDKLRIEREARFIRAYSLWYLAQVYCLPYTEANKNELGLVLKKSTSFNESVRRATLEQTYQFIEADLNEALKTETNLISSSSKNRIWRESKVAVYGFAARYYLNRSNYAKAKEYAELALGLHSNLVDYNVDVSYSPSSPSKVVVDGKPVEIYYPSTYSNGTTLSLGWKESYYYRALYNNYAWFIPSKRLLDLYDKTYDLRYKYHIVEHLSYMKGLKSPSYDYPGYVFFGMYNIPSGPSVSEMLLIKAECLAREGQTEQAMDAVNTLRAKRFDKTAPAAVINLSALTPDEALVKILQERRRECPFTQRWYDIRRFNSNDDPRDDIGDLTRTFYSYNSSSITPEAGLKTYTLPKNSRRYAQPIHYYEIETSDGVIEQNHY